ncbi:hypothetical protein HX004_08255 [Myroides sp. 1354]|uniref:hypothetical protein n=1 Tax=unclassified Myroides TaxID=2642485 RepID=UPI002575A3C3|nr:MULTISPECIES: hypothetical protein [unclassified Myroides]MDM1045778.1 hypothetical protein [Myroides sp. R163-1]MDM1055767.1 hypothetical protein [Myroides sp. 1354]MDM1069859.1 hypothetical protein [Myroides sp. 1372]
MKRLSYVVSFVLLSSLATISCSSDDNKSSSTNPITVDQATGTYLGKVEDKGNFAIVLKTKQGEFNLKFISDVVKDENLLEAAIKSETYIVSDAGHLYTLSSASTVKNAAIVSKITAGELAVVSANGTHTFKGTLQDEQGVKYDINYTQAIDIEPIYDVTYEIQNGWYWGDNVFDHPNVAEYMTYFTQGDANSYGELKEDGTGYHISLSFFDQMAPKAWEAKVPNKTFKASTAFEVGAFRVGSKEAIENGEDDYSFASFQHKDKAAGIDEELYILDGSIKVMEHKQGQEIRFNILLENGTRHLGKYTGTVKQGDQYTISTLRADKEVKKLTQGFMEYKGKSPITAKQNNRWNLYLYSETLTPHPGQYFWVEGSGEWMRVTLYTDLNATTDIPLGEFPIGDENVGNAGEGGGSEVGLDWGTWFFEQTINREGESVTSGFAPTRTGTVKVEKTGDQYTITVNAIDDRENKITASYTGALTFVNNASKAAAQQTKVAKKSYGKGTKFDAAKNSRK